MPVLPVKGRDVPFCHQWLGGAGVLCVAPEWSHDSPAGEPWEYQTLLWEFCFPYLLKGVWGGAPCQTHTGFVRIEILSLCKQSINKKMQQKMAGYYSYFHHSFLPGLCWCFRYSCQGERCSRNVWESCSDRTESRPRSCFCCVFSVLNCVASW